MQVSAQRMDTSVTDAKRVRCNLCPKACEIAPGQSGECRIRVNLDGKLVAVTYGYPCSAHIDPIEKKPMFHFLPGTGSLSIATVGCNLHCLNCQNWEISQRNPEDEPAFALPPEAIAPLAVQQGCQSVAYTYTDPVVYYEYAYDSCIKVREAGLKNVLVTAGYINKQPLRDLCRYVDGAKIDLKSMSDTFYRDICGATLQPVLNALVVAKEAGVWVEVTNLVIPTLNDRDEDFQRLCTWMAENMGKDTPLHFSAFFPNYKMTNLPPTPGDTLVRARDIARAEGLHFVYIGNVSAPDGETTHCPHCGKLLIERRRFTIIENRLNGGRCPDCQTALAGVWL
ncbi:MAG: pyruvate formate lyase activating enzyme [Candidatus Hydrogenedentes bacterium]|nr:pyruvate formate lyase activating enzyme [Candidatus Hydrogenedentota bacterium]